MSRYIDADALPRHGNRGGIVHWKDIEEAPTADVRENVRGNWQIGQSEKPKRYAGMFCSNCGFEVCCANKGWNVYISDNYHYCPNCGADMRGGYSPKCC